MSTVHNLPISARLARLALFLTLAAGIAVLMLRAHGLDLLPVSVSVPQPTTGVVFELRNIFGDHVPSAEIVVNGRYKQITDEFGVAGMSGLPIGDVEVKIAAPGYRPIQRMVYLGPGENQVQFRNEGGLVPDRFAVDYHVFWNTASGGLARGIVEITIYNGTTSPMYVTECDIYFPGGSPVLKLLGSEEAFADFTEPYSTVDIVSQPEMALRILPGQIVYADPVVLPGLPRDGDLYSLRLVATNNLSAPRDKWEVVSLVDVMDYDGDWDPHVP